jgi:hypothetical protein
MKAGIAALTATAAVFARGASGDADRKKAVQRPRRVIFNNDGNDAFVTDAPATPEGFLSVRMDHFAGCGIDSVFYCTAMSSLFTHQSKVLEVTVRSVELSVQYVAENRAGSRREAIS